METKNPYRNVGVETAFVDLDMKFGFKTSTVSIILIIICTGGLWVPVTTAWRFLRLRMEERPPIWRVAANILNKQSRTADKRWSSSLGVGRGAKNSSP